MSGALLQLAARGASDVWDCGNTCDPLPANMHASASHWFAARLNGDPQEADLRDVEVRHRPDIEFPYDVRRDKLDRAQLEYVLLERGVARGLHSPDEKRYTLLTRYAPPCAHFGAGASGFSS